MSKEPTRLEEGLYPVKYKGMTLGRLLELTNGLPDNIVVDKHETTGKWTIQYLTDEQADKCLSALKEASDD